MFESPFKSDFDFGTEFGSSAQHPFSLRSRLREVRDAFRGFRVIYKVFFVVGFIVCDLSSVFLHSDRAILWVSLAHIQPGWSRVMHYG